MISRTNLYVSINVENITFTETLIHIHVSFLDKSTMTMSSHSANHSEPNSAVHKHSQ